MKIEIYCALSEDILTKILQKCLLSGRPPSTLQSLYNTTGYNMVLVIARPGFGS